MKLVLVLLLMASVLIGCAAQAPPGNPHVLPPVVQVNLLIVDCSAVLSQNNRNPSGEYMIFPTEAPPPVQVHCDMESEGGGWTVIQRRIDGSLNFYRPWDQYKMGFGNAAGEYWLGLENIYQLTQYGNQELLVTMEDFEGNTASARYSSFSVGEEGSGYTLRVSGFIDGGAGDALSYHNRMRFSTFDKDQDTWRRNCAKSFHGAFWYKACSYANPNGAYRYGADDTLLSVGVEWEQWKGVNYSLKKISMMIRPRQ